MGFQHLDKEQLSKITSKGGKKSSSHMSAEARSKRARAAALARWGVAPEPPPEVTPGGPGRATASPLGADQ